MLNNRVVIIEDEENIVDILSYRLSSEPLAVTFIQEGLLAIKAIRDIKPAIVFLDLNLPGKSGYDILTEMKQSKDLCTIPVILCSANLEYSQSHKAMGADDILVKPYDIQDLINKVYTYLEVLA